MWSDILFIIGYALSNGLILLYLAFYVKVKHEEYKKMIDTNKK